MQLVSHDLWHWITCDQAPLDWNHITPTCVALLEMFWKGLLRTVHYLVWLPLGQKKVSCLVWCPDFRQPLNSSGIFIDFIDWLQSCHVIPLVMEWWDLHVKVAKWSIQWSAAIMRFILPIMIFMLYLWKPQSLCYIKSIKCTQQTE